MIKVDNNLYLTFGREYNQPTTIPNSVIKLIWNEQEITIEQNTNIFHFE